MGDPMAPSESEGNSEGGGSEQAGRLAAPGGLGTKEKIPMPPCWRVSPMIGT